MTVSPSRSTSTSNVSANAQPVRFPWLTARSITVGLVTLAIVVILGIVGTMSGIIRPLVASPSTYNASSNTVTEAAPTTPTARSTAQAPSHLMREISIPVTTSTANNATVPTQLVTSHGPAGADGSVAPRADPCRHKKCVALTFDDGPGPYTKQLLAELKKQHVNATFFLIGNRVSKWADVARMEVRNGNEVCGHSWSHKDLGAMSLKAIRHDTEKVSNAIQRATGVTITCMRPPYGALSKPQAKATGLKNYLWNVDTLDWKTRNTKKTIKAATKHIRPGSVIIMHDIHKSTVKAIPSIIKKLKHKGFHLTTVDDLLVEDHPTPGHKYFER